MSNFWIDLFLVSLFLIMIYVFIFLPRQMSFRRSQKFVKQKLNPGDEIITFGGMIGSVKEIRADEGIVLVEFAPGVEIRMLSTSIASPYDQQYIAEEAQKGQ